MLLLVCYDILILYYDTAYGYHGGQSELVAGSGAFIAPMALSLVDTEKQPECCINCHSCEKVCPQTIHIPEELAKFAKKMGR